MRRYLPRERMACDHETHVRHVRRTRCGSARILGRYRLVPLHTGTVIAARTKHLRGPKVRTWKLGSDRERRRVIRPRLWVSDDATISVSHVRHRTSQLGNQAADLLFRPASPGTSPIANSYRTIVLIDAISRESTCTICAPRGQFSAGQLSSRERSPLRTPGTKTIPTLSPSSRSTVPFTVSNDAQRSKSMIS